MGTHIRDGSSVATSFDFDVHVFVTVLSIENCISLSYVSVFRFLDLSHMHLYHMTNSANQNSSCNHEAENKASIKIPTVIMFCKQTVLCIAYEICK